VSERAPVNKRPRRVPTAQLTETITRMLHPTVFANRPWGHDESTRDNGARYALAAAHWGPDTRVAISLRDHGETEEFFDSVRGLEFEKRIEILDIIYRSEAAYGMSVPAVLQNDKKKLYDWIASCERLKMLRLDYDATLLPSNVTDLSRLTCLTSLHLNHSDSNCDFRAGDSHPLFGRLFNQLTNLRELKYMGYQKMTTSALVSLTSLTDLALAGWEVDLLDFSFLVGLKKLTLQVKTSVITSLLLPISLEKFRCVVTHAELLFSNSLGTMGSGNLFGCTNLRTLSLYSTSEKHPALGRYHIEVPPDLARLQNLEVLELGGSEKRAIVMLPRILLPALRSIELWGCKLKSQLMFPLGIPLTFRRSPPTTTPFDF
jgi:hypothetical protein